MKPLLTKRHIKVLVLALESGSSLEEAAALSKLTSAEIEEGWLKGRNDRDAGRESPEATLYVEGRAAAARYRVSRRTAAAEAADLGHRNAGDHLKLLEEARGAVDVIPKGDQSMDRQLNALSEYIDGVRGSDPELDQAVSDMREASIRLFERLGAPA